MTDELKPGDIAKTPSGIIVRIESIQPPSEENWPYHEHYIAITRVVDGRGSQFYPQGARGHYCLDDLRRHDA